jgi:hypothetical protein
MALVPALRTMVLTSSVVAPASARYASRGTAGQPGWRVSARSCHVLFTSANLCMAASSLSTARGPAAGMST